MNCIQFGEHLASDCNYLSSKRQLLPYFLAVMRTCCTETSSPKVLLDSSLLSAVSISNCQSSCRIQTDASITQELVLCHGEISVGQPVWIAFRLPVLTSDDCCCCREIYEEEETLVIACFELISRLFARQKSSTRHTSITMICLID